MMMALKFVFLAGFPGFVASTATITMNSLAQGSEFNQCILQTDFTTKGLNNAITVTNRGLDGCCPTGQWNSECKMYSKSQSFFGESVGYCLSYAKKYKLEGTNEKTDDQADGKLALTTIKAYTGCAPFTPVGTGSPSPAPAAPGVAPADASGCPAVTGVTKMVLNTMAQGSEFTKCIKVSDFNSKSMFDEVEVVDRDANTGCCPKCWIPGIKWYNQYWGAMVVCGFKEDGSVNMGMSTSNNVQSCTYNKCYVVKMDITCADNTKMRIDGCCPKDQWDSECKMYSKSQSFFNHNVGYCLSYAKTYKLEGTTEKTDDQAGGKLALSNIYSYTACAGFNPAAAPEPASNQETSPAAQASIGLLGVVGALVAIM